MKLYGYQEELARSVRQGKNIILQAPTGAGKTMASLWPFLQNWAADENHLPRKCIYAVPMRVLANQFDAEYNKIIKEEMLIASPPGIKKQTGEYKDDPEFRADMTFATIDQVLSGWLMSPYSLPKRLGNMNAGAFVGSYLIFDEFHLFDPDSTLPTTLQMLKTLNGISPFVLMTATFSKEMLEKLAHHLNAEAFLLTEEMLAEIPAQKKDRRFYTTTSPMTFKDDDKRIWADETAVSHIIQTHQGQTIDKPRTLVVCNQVERAQAVYTALHNQVEDGVTVRLLHSRFLKKDRQEIEGFVRDEFQKKIEKRTVPSLIVVATQVVEVGLDMSAAVLHTDLAPAASVLQRAGRCARYEGESGKVYVYPLDEKGYAPYHGTYAKQQCELGWEWLQENQDRHLTFADEQTLINHAHTASDNKILDAVFGAEYERATQIWKAWSGDMDRGEVAKLIRNIQSVSVAVHADPDQLIAAPFKADSFSLHPGTLQGKFTQWQTKNDALDPDWDDGHLDWLVCKLVEDVDKENLQGNRPITYGFKEATSKYDLNASMLVVHPDLVGYSPELGLTLYKGEHYECDVPETAVRTYTAYGYKLESYYRHIELVHEAFVNDSLTLFSASAGRLEKAYGWQDGIITEMAHLVMAVHDVGKLSEGWQGWARKWQKAIGNGELPFPAAHTDYDPMNPKHKIKVGKRPSHAVESALASMPILQSLVSSDMGKYGSLLRAAFTAVARHHAPFSSQPGSYQLIPDHMQEIESTLKLLSENVQKVCQDVDVRDETDVKRDLPPKFIERYMLINPRNERDVCCYMLLVRALRTSDQEGTKKGSQ